jgi:Kef-type K+ transport system membrane component KefB|tara:strand:- start:91017 stop:91409 length:393 start_codon:yes stop_codon:yes gene_type:complete
MNRKDRNINLFLFLFFIAVGLYMSVSGSWNLITSEQENLFDFQNKDIPIFTNITQLLTGLICLFSGFIMWMRVHWAFSFSLFSSGLLIAYNLNNMGRAIYENPTEAIIMAVILVIVLQSLPFLIRQNQRI